MTRLGEAAREAREAFRARPGELVILVAAAVLVMASYGFVRPAADSLFIRDYGSASLPWAWLAVAVAAVATTIAYNRLAAVMALARLWPLAAAASIAIGVLLWAAERGGVAHASFALYVWKDLYIVVMVELFWSVANVSYPIRQARWAYGLFLAAGSLGSMAGELAVGPLAAVAGSWAAVLVIVPLLAAAAALSPWLPAAARRPPAPGDERPSLVATLRRGAVIIASSRYLALLVGLVATIQIAITVIDYQYNVALERHVPDLDERTAVTAQIYAATNGAALVLQLLTGPLLKLAGVPLILIAIPGLLGAGLLGFALSPRFLTMGIVKVASKAFDYSLGRAAKEILYIPLGYREKTEGKALVDLLTYRVAKGAASGLLLWLTATRLGPGAALVLLAALLGLWLLLAWRLGRRFRASA